MDKAQREELFYKEKELLDTFLSHGALSKAQYIKSLTCLAEKMGVSLPEDEQDQKKN